jgi:hypothetical protein
VSTNGQLAVPRRWIWPAVGVALVVVAASFSGGLLMGNGSSPGPSTTTTTGPSGRAAYAECRWEADKDLNGNLTGDYSRSVLWPEDDDCSSPFGGGFPHDCSLVPDKNLNGEPTGDLIQDGNCE